jgi:hypothetical protein
LELLLPLLFSTIIIAPHSIYHCLRPVLLTLIIGLPLCFSLTVIGINLGALRAVSTACVSPVSDVGYLGFRLN